ncbi:hypothetical protein SARC_07451 [Sphaeroforma arctica JP610]|uniref:G-patch domain-containing protein n=1 Tax=Sphaeroforma arctica JP610 TaxID=667725 RepID=A0A0L0FTP6_9EUKA|nr:hypothetical protein SARC_07451 [Sphaeroforma arctica JP610]KNC80190.1 hypothetical protein SARC_07451 [Sphaeroforma arctica JP610]|eukprot:XP_014154092.1 hypothetical protein SARC_07451 [Sphaeroforma arctica JP610]
MSSHVVVGAIPEHYASIDLRVFFDDLVEAGMLTCFHYQHRKEPDAPTRSCMIALDPKHMHRLIVYNGTPWTDRNDAQTDATMTARVTLNLVRWTGVGKGSHKTTTDQLSQEKDSGLPVVEVPNVLRPNITELQPPQYLPNGMGVLGLDMLLMVRARDHFSAYMAMDAQLSASDILREFFKGGIYNVRLAGMDFSGFKVTGNVGTPMHTLQRMIEECKLPVSVIRRLELNTRRRIRTGPNGKAYTDVRMLYPETTENPYDYENTYNQQHPTNEDEPEEWDRYEALHDDVDEQERIKERTFEGDVEVTWDKGSSGLVFYTDTQYWNANETEEADVNDWDADERINTPPCTDVPSDLRGPYTGKPRAREGQRGGWGVDVVYLDHNTRQRAAMLERDLEQREWDVEHMREQAAGSRDSATRHIRASTSEEYTGPDSTKSSTPTQASPNKPQWKAAVRDRYAPFEASTKGVGSTILYRSGWRPGLSLGKTGRGALTTPLEAQGQSAHTRTGLGYSVETDRSVGFEVGGKGPAKRYDTAYVKIHTPGHQSRTHPGSEQVDANAHAHTHSPHGEVHAQTRTGQDRPLPRGADGAVASGECESASPKTCHRSDRDRDWATDPNGPCGKDTQCVGDTRRGGRASVDTAGAPDDVPDGHTHRHDTSDTHHTAEAHDKPAPGTPKNGTPPFDNVRPSHSTETGSMSQEKSVCGATDSGVETAHASGEGGTGSTSQAVTDSGPRNRKAKSKSKLILPVGYEDVPWDKNADTEDARAAHTVETSSHLLPGNRGYSVKYRAVAFVGADDRATTVKPVPQPHTPGVMPGIRYSQPYFTSQGATTKSCNNPT